jgi:hypothetical protein
MDLKVNLNNLKLAFKDIKVKLFFIFSFISFFLITIFLNEQHIALPLMFKLELFNAISFLVVLFLNSALFGIVFALSYYKFSTHSFNSQGTVIGSIAGFIAFLGGACAACYAGVLPALLIILGISFSLTSMPLNGLEIMLFSSLLLLISIYFLSKPLDACKIPKKKK